MRQENGFWIDENNNRWSTEKYTEDKAIEYSKSLTDCRGCRSCEYCKNCVDCVNCKGSEGCEQGNDE